MKEGKIFEKLKDNFKSDIYPLHMPGHKRSLYPDGFEIPYGLDITEIEGFDDLHHPEGLLKDAMDKAASYYGTKATFYLVNGSSCGNLAAICSQTEYGDEILASRNCHKSVYNAVKLRNLKINIIEINDDGEVSAHVIEDALKDNKNIKVCVITSPNYEGVVSDIESISKVCRNNNVKLIVDEAHGAHLLSEDFPKSAIKCGADIVIQSLHKTLPSLTQTAVLHVCSEDVSVDKIREYLGIFESSSPSYILMGSIDSCIDYMKECGMDELHAFSKRLDKFYDSLMSLKVLKINRFENAFAHDKSKIVVSLNDTYFEEYKKLYNDGFGILLGNILRYNYKIEVEMSAVDYIIAMTTIADTDDGLKRVADALLSIDILLSDNLGCFKNIDEINKRKQLVDMEYLKANVNKESKVYIYAYPPGSPMITYGEIITEDVISNIESSMASGLTCYQIGM